MALRPLQAFCPKCRCTAKGAVLDGEREPQHNDIALCLGCGEFLMFDLRRHVRNNLRLPSLMERFEISRNSRAQLLRTRWNARIQNASGIA